MCMLSRKRLTSALEIYTDWKGEWWEKKVFHANGNQKKSRAAILWAWKNDFKIKTLTRDKEGHYIRSWDQSKKI